jgi:DNA-binding XRE family transcriptional regulator
MKHILVREQSKEPLVNYVRVHRRRACLSQRELGQVLGYRDEGAVARHERFRSLPPLLIALGYEIIFQQPVAELFPGLKQTVAFGIEMRMAEFENDLRTRSGAGPQAAAIARKLEWLSERRSSAISSI